MSEDSDGKGFLLCHVGVLVFVSSLLLLYEEAGLEVFVEAGIGTVSGTKGLCQVAEGTSDCASTQGLAIASLASAVVAGREEFFPEELCECGYEDVALPSCEGVEEGVVVETDVVEEFEEAPP